MPIRMAPRTQAVEAEGGAGWGVRGRAARAGRSLPGPGRLVREAPGRDWPGRVADERPVPARPVDRADEERLPDVDPEVLPDVDPDVDPEVARTRCAASVAEPRDAHHRPDARHRPGGPLMTGGPAGTACGRPRGQPWAPKRLASKRGKAPTPA